MPPVRWQKIVYVQIIQFMWMRFIIIVTLIMRQRFFFLVEVALKKQKDKIHSSAGYFFYQKLNESLLMKLAAKISFSERAIKIVFDFLSHDRFSSPIRIADQIIMNVKRCILFSFCTKIKLTFHVMSRKHDCRWNHIDSMLMLLFSSSLFSSMS